MGLFDWLFNETSLGQNGEENGVEVTYTGGTVKHIDDSEIGYDAKIESHKDGTTHYYTSSDGFQSHSHDVSLGDDIVYSRDDNEDVQDHPWTDREHYIKFLESLSIEDLTKLKEYLVTLQYETNNISYNYQHNKI